jgi:hypothetical protein
MAQQVGQHRRCWQALQRGDEDVGTGALMEDLGVRTRLSVRREAPSGAGITWYLTPPTRSEAVDQAVIGVEYCSPLTDATRNKHASARAVLTLIVEVNGWASNLAATLLSE